ERLAFPRVGADLLHPRGCDDGGDRGRSGPVRAPPRRRRGVPAERHAPELEPGRRRDQAPLDQHAPQGRLGRLRNPMSQLRDIARFARELRFSDLPDDVVLKAKQISLNSLGVQIAASTLPWSKASYRFARSQGGRPESTVVNYGFRTTAANAAFVNG